MLIVVAVLLAATLWTFVAYNRLNRLTLTADALWAAVEVALRLRHELVPELVNAASSDSNGPRDAFRRTAVARGIAARSARGGPRRRGPHEEELTLGLEGVLELAASDPDLGSHETFLLLREELELIERRIETSRRAYNEAADRLNSAITSAPSSLVARVFGYSRRERFTR